MSSGALRLMLAPGPTRRTVAVHLAATPEGWSILTDALQAQRAANAATSQALAKWRTFKRALTGDLPASGESWPPKG